MSSQGEQATEREATGSIGGATDVEAEEVESAGHRMDYAPAAPPAPDRPPTREQPAAAGFSLHEALVKLAAEFERTHGCDRGGDTLVDLPWPGGSRLDFDE
jgi:hypothetical protein